MSEYTTTREREEIVVETTTETEELVVCACCGQAYTDDDPIVTVGVDLDDDHQPWETRPVCKACASAALDYDEPKGLGWVGKAAWERDLADRAKSAVGRAIPTAVTLGVMAITGAVGISVANAVAESVSQNAAEFDQAAQPVGDILSLLPMILIVSIAVIILSMLNRGRRI